MSAPGDAADVDPDHAAVWARARRVLVPLLAVLFLTVAGCLSLVLSGVGPGSSSLVLSVLVAAAVTGWVYLRNRADVSRRG